MKKFLAILLIMGFVLPMAAGAVTRPVTKIERCTLRHDFTKEFGPDYATGNTIGVVSIGAEAGEAGVVGDWPDGTEINWTDTVYGASAKANLRSQLAVFAILPLQEPCNASIAQIKENDHKINKQRFDAVKNCKMGVGPLQMDATNRNGVCRAMLQFLEASAVAEVGGVIEAKDAAIVCLLDLIETIGDWFFVVILVGAGIFILWGAATLVFAGGAPDKITKARNILIWALVGVAVAFLSKGLVKLVEQIIA